MSKYLAIPFFILLFCIKFSLCAALLDSFSGECSPPFPGVSSAPSKDLIPEFSLNSFPNETSNEAPFKRLAISKPDLCFSVDDRSQLPLKDFYFIRGAKTNWSDGHYIGKLNILLSEIGKKQAQNFAEKIKELPLNIDYIATSTLERTKKTVQFIMKGFHTPPEEIDFEAFTEWRGGRQEGTFTEKWSKGMIPPLENIHCPIPQDAEENELFRQRIFQGMKEALNLKGNVLIVSHLGVFGAIERILGFNVTSIENCQLAFFEAPTSTDPEWKLYLPPL